MYIKPSTKLTPQLVLAADIAGHYGFVNVESVPDKKNAPKTKKWSGKINRGVQFKHLHSVRNRYAAQNIPSLDESPLARCLANGKLFPSSAPTLIYSYGPDISSKKKTASIRLETLGLEGALAEALLVRTAMSVFEEMKSPTPLVEINSIGDAETMIQFRKELNIFCKKQGSGLPDCAMRHLRTNIFDLFICSNPKCQNVREDAPRPISFLETAHRRHLSEVLEYFESMNINYRLNDFLIDSRMAFTKTIFELHSEEKDRGYIKASGGRYEWLAKQLGAKNHIPAASITITINRGCGVKTHNTLKTKKPQILFIQIGPEARKRSLAVLETLRKANVPVVQSLGIDSLSSQIQYAENQKLPYTVIIGHKEALDDTAIIRNTDTRSQDTIPIKNLPKYLKTEVKYLV